MAPSSAVEEASSSCGCEAVVHWAPKEKSSDSVKRHLSRRHLSALNLKFDFISDGGCTREAQIALSLKRHLFPQGGRETKAFCICFSTLPPILNIFSNFLELSTKAAFAKAAFDTLRSQWWTRLSVTQSTQFNLGCSRLHWGKFFYLQLELFCLQLSVFAYSPQKCVLDTLSHCQAEMRQKCKPKWVLFYCK